MTDYKDTTPPASSTISNEEAAATPTARKRGRPAKAAETPPRAKAKAKAPVKPKAPPKAPPRPKAAARPANATHRKPGAAVTPILQQLADMNDAGTMTPEIAAAGLRFAIALMGGRADV
jgi:hypothetical protein